MRARLPSKRPLCVCAAPSHREVRQRHRARGHRRKLLQLLEQRAEESVLLLLTSVACQEQLQAISQFDGGVLLLLPFLLCPRIVQRRDE